MSLSVLESLRAVISAYAGAEQWWAEMFFSLGWSEDHLRRYLDTALQTPGSVLQQTTERALCDELKVYAGPRGMLPDGDMAMGKSDPRVVVYVKSPMTFEEREAVLGELASVAVVHFVPNAAKCYVDHTVASAVTSTMWKWLHKLTGDGKVLEVGPNKVTVLLAAMEPDKYVGYTPCLGARDATRHDVDGLVKRMRSPFGAFSLAQRQAGEEYVKNPGLLFRDVRIEDDDEQGEYIISNHADYDIDLDDVPGIMAKHGARVWYGVVTRPRGISSTTASVEGEIPALGVRYEIDRSRDAISFHFRGRASFAYEHRFSTYVKREERNEYRWRGEHYDYVYTKLPASTAAMLVYAVYRVKRAASMFVEPTYVASGLKGMVQVESIRVYPVTGKWRVSPVTFSVSRVALEKVIEHRRAQGHRGNVGDVMQYLGSVRVRYVMNGVHIGAENPLSADLFGAAAVFVEAYVALTRMGDELDGTKLAVAYDKFVTERGFFSQVAFWAQGVATSVARRPVATVRRWREALERMLAGYKDFRFSMTPHPDVVQVSTGEAEGIVKDQVVTAACVCREVIGVRAALQDEELYSESELAELREYLSRLEADIGLCRCGWREERAVPVESVSSGSSTCVEDSDVASDVFVDARSFNRRDAVAEYVGLMRYTAKALDVHSVEEAALLFRSGVPDENDLQRAKTGRLTPYAVRVKNGRIVKVRGEAVAADIGAIVDVNRMTVVPTRRGGRSARVSVDCVEDGWHYSSSALEVYNAEALADAAQHVLDDDEAMDIVQGLDVRFVRGPFGCGKTTAVASLLARDARAGLDIMYLSATVSSAEEVVEKLAELGVTSVRCATFDSFMMNKHWTACRLYIDEGPMAHYGESLAAMGKARVKEVAAFGDFEQIPFCSFTAEYDTPLASMEKDVRVVKKMNVLHRCRAEVLAMWDHLYDGELVPCSCCPHVREDGKFMSVKRIAGVNEVPLVPGARYIVFTQREKEKLREHVGGGASIKVLKKRKKGGMATVHESQGGTFPEVIVVRLTEFWDRAQSELMPTLYNKVPYVLVATTRARKSLTYYTVSLERDAVVRAIEGVSEDDVARVKCREVEEQMDFSDLFTC